MTARSLANDVTLLADIAAPDATADRGLVTLLAGETASFLVSTAEPDLAEQLTGPAVLRSANGLRASAVVRPRRPWLSSTARSGW